MIEKVKSGLGRGSRKRGVATAPAPYFTTPSPNPSNGDPCSATSGVVSTSRRPSWLSPGWSPTEPPCADTRQDHQLDPAEGHDPAPFMHLLVTPELSPVHASPAAGLASPAAGGFWPGSCAWSPRLGGGMAAPAGCADRAAPWLPATARLGGGRLRAPGEGGRRRWLKTGRRGDDHRWGSAVRRAGAISGITGRICRWPRTGCARRAWPRPPRHGR